MSKKMVFLQLVGAKFLLVFLLVICQNFVNIRHASLVNAFISLRLVSKTRPAQFTKDGFCKEV